MYFVGLGLVLVLLKLIDWMPVAGWSWWLILAPFAAAAAWWSYADKSGFTKRRAMEKMEARKEQRRREQMMSLGMDPKQRDRSARSKKAIQAAKAKAESARESSKRKNRDTIARSSRIDSQQSSIQPIGTVDAKR